jgi:hypothetical protein
MPPMSATDRSGFVEFQLRLARRALESGELGAARAALRVLRATDLAGDGSACERHFAVLREPRSPEAEVRAAITALVALRPAELRTNPSRRAD